MSVPTLPMTVTTERLTLTLWSADDVAAIRAGGHRPGWHPDYPRRADRDAAGLWVDGDPWGPRHIVRGVTALGSVGFFGPPDEAVDGVLETEVGYGLVEQARGWGFATEALTALLVATDAGAVRVRASVEPTNKPSIRVLATCRFTQLRGSDEDGNLIMVRPLPPPVGHRGADLDG
ncbi:MAG: GNAT family N-acetyltransferase [Nocardioides sp.]|nr:GNAT family N-acetyltransferase [Nocardioides sp.]